MSFEIKYDRDGQPIRQQAAQPAPEPEVEAAPVEQEIIEVAEAPEQVETEVEVQEEVAPEQPRAESIKYAPKSLNHNVIELRKQKEQAERERDEAMRLLRQSESQRADSKRRPEPAHEDIPDFSINDDDLVEGKHVKQLANELKKVRQEINTYKQQSTEMSAEAKLKMQYPDFDKVVSPDNLRSYADAEPEIAASLHYNPDLYVKAVAAYKAIKKAGIYVEDTFVAEKQAAQKNAAKPRPVSSLSPQQGDSPLTKANAFAQGLTPDLQKQLQKEMNEARKNL